MVMVRGRVKSLFFLGTSYFFLSHYFGGGSVPSVLLLLGLLVLEEFFGLSVVFVELFYQTELVPFYHPS